MTTERERELYNRGLERSRGSLWGRIKGVLAGKPSLGEDEIEQLEEILISGDVGVKYTAKLLDDLRRSISENLSERQAKAYIRGWIERCLNVREQSTEEWGLPVTNSLRVIIIVGVNGTGKTTTVGKLAHRIKDSGSRAMVVAADTYRAAAVNQLKIWADRSGVLFSGGREGGDPAAVVHDALTGALKTGVQYVLIDTAGRLHTKEPLMRELEKIANVAGRIVDGAPHEVLLVLDATTGQNALVQAREFVQAARVTGIVMSKMDGSARGGILIPIAGELGVPVRFIGLGEGLEDLVVFDAAEYAKGLVGE